MVVIRLARGGAKKRPFYHVVVADKRKPRDGRYIERIGYYNPVAKGQELRFKLDQDRYNHWLSTGAQPSNRVEGLFSLLSESKDKQGDQIVLLARDGNPRKQKIAAKKAALKAEEAKKAAEAAGAEQTEEQSAADSAE